MTEIICKDEQGIIWNVPSHSSDETYVCAIDEEGQVFCSCPDWLFRHSHNNSKCKHLEEVLNNA